MADTALRYVEMLRHLPALPRRITAAELQQRLKAAGYAISRRSVERDLNKLSEKFGIVGDENARPAGWAWSKGAGFSAPGMDVIEAMELDMAARYLRPLLPTSVWQALAPRLNEARATLKLLSTAPLARWRSSVAYIDDGQPLIAPKVDPVLLAATHHALLTSKRFSADYFSLGADEPRRFEVNPIALVYVGQVGYLVATLWDYTDVRHLALHRMSSPQGSEKKATRPEGFDLQRYLLDDAAFDIPSEREWRLKLRVSDWLARHLSERPLSEDQRVAQDKGNENHWVVQATVRESERLVWWLRSHGDAVEVIQPVALRKRLAGEFQALATLYTQHD